MRDDQYKNLKDDLKEHLENVLQAKVNGKIDKISVRMDKLDAFIERAGPAVEFFENVTWLKTVLIGFLTFVALVGGAWAVITQFIIKK